MSRRAVARWLLAFLVLLGSAGSAAAAPEDCFGSGKDLEIGTEGPTIDATLYTSLFTNLGGKGSFGASFVGSTGEYEVIGLRTGVVFAGVGSDPAAFLGDPFSRFALAFDYRFSLPMFGDGFDYEESEVPVSGVPEAECSVE
ncbi:DUF7332 family protein [Candidatus Halobonum tyrrellensis]|uniref:Uncharacterized protein n=1 Tax=Candidatus Halobonum tyrrellensis G22 TaxID=1324957 RepID=V4GV64_9EURY|nr:hypothetical protein [Candidatus Halobonum tyrrellensis]ESP89041.1 hypothetical protein K933_06313 [Candidatus Halobonum tyrrellensis G22]